jgi:dolichol-phosphate mannosyltransferase
VTAPVWVILPTYEERENVEPLTEAVVGEMRRTGLPFRVLIVDDASPDGTGEAADGLAARLPEVEVLHRAAKDGLGRAYQSGFVRALAEGAERVVEMDADFSHDPAHLPALLAAGPLRRLVSRAGCLYARRVLGVGVRDLTGGYKVLHRRVLEAIDVPSLRGQGYVFQVEVTYRALLAGFRVCEIPIVFRDRRRGRSKMSPRIAVEAIWLVPSLRRRAERAVRVALRTPV